MATIDIQLTEEDGPRVEAFSGRLFMAGMGALELLTIELGVQLGLYETLVRRGPSTSAELADAAGIAERYAREWLEQQAVTEILEVDDVTADASTRRYTLPPAHALVLLDPDSPATMAPVSGFVVRFATVVPAIAEAYRTGGGVPYADYAIHDYQAAFNRPTFIHTLVPEWLPALPELHAKLESGERVRIAEIGCGEGLASLAIARAYPNAEVDGFDLDDASIAAARKHASEAGVADRVRFEVRDASKGTATGTYDLVMAIEMLHDVPDPVGILRTMRSLRAKDGTVLVVDERVAETFTAPGDEIERFLYACSVTHCLVVGMTEEDSAATGTVMRPDTVRRYAEAAGFDAVEILPVEHMLFRLYRLDG